MHGFSSGSNLLVNAEVDSMGGIFDSGAGIGTKTSPRQAAIEKAQAELRSEYDVREERRRELEFLEKGGNPLDFRFGVTAPVSVQSSSLADQLHGQLGTCEAKGGFPLAASSRGDSIGSSGRLGATIGCEPNSADNFDGDNELNENKGKATYANKSNIAPFGNSSQFNGSQNVKELEDSPIFHPKKAYRRRNRSKTNRDCVRSSSSVIGSRVGYSSLSVRNGLVSKAAVDEVSRDAEMVAVDTATDNPNDDELDLPISKKMHDDPRDENVQKDGVLTDMPSGETDSSVGKGQIITEATEKPENDNGREQLMKLDALKDDGSCPQTEGVVSNNAITLKGLESELSCTQTAVSADGNGNIDNGSHANLKNAESSGGQILQKAHHELTTDSNDEKVLKDGKAADIADGGSCINDSHYDSRQANGFLSEAEGKTNKKQFSPQCEAKCMPCTESIQTNQQIDSILVAKQGLIDDSIPKVESSCLEKPQGPQKASVDEQAKSDIPCPLTVSQVQPCDVNQTKMVDKAQEDRILEEARNVKAKRKFIEELSFGPLPKEYRRKSQWDFVLEEMAWMANDFAQERVWKRTAAAQLCHRTAFACQLRLEERDKHRSVKFVAKALAKAVTEFWLSAALLAGEIHDGSDLKIRGSLDEDCPEGSVKQAVQAYAVRFLQHNGSVVPPIKDAFLETSERVSYVDIPKKVYQNQLEEEDLFYVIAPGAMEAYRKSIERYMVLCERAGKSLEEEVGTSMYDAGTEFEYQENDFEEEGENMYYAPGDLERRRASKFTQKKRKNSKFLTPRSYEGGGDILYGNGTEDRQAAARRPPNGLSICPIPTKRVRTASRQRVVGPFNAGAAGMMSFPSRTDASSGDTNSFQDDQSTLHGGSHIPKGLEVESGMDYDKQSAFDSANVMAKPKKKKKTKHQATAYDQRWQVDRNLHIEQRGHFKRRLENHQGNSGLFGPHAKKLKIMKQALGNSFENTALMSGSVASPVGSQMSNMSNQNKLIKLIGGRDRGRKTKSLKVPFGQNGSGSPWSLFEDQALVVLVHDMGQNWELVSDAINSTMHFKCIFRKPNECKERHAIVMEKNSGDGADTEDSGSSQPYPSTLPGIPKGGAWQLFQQLRGPMEEDTIKSHFEKLIFVGQQLHGRRKQEPKQLVPAHNSHLAALSQVIPNNVNGSVLTPLDLCDMAASSPDVFSLGYQGPHAGGLPLPDQGVGQSVHPPSTNTSLQGSPSMGLASDLSSQSAHHSGHARDGRYGVSRMSSPVDEQYRIQQHSHMFSNRVFQQPGMPVPGMLSGNDRGGRRLPSVGGVVMPGVSRSMSMPRPGSQGIPSSSLMNSGSVAASNMVGVPSSMSMHPGISSGQGNTMIRPRDALHMVRPGQNQEPHRQMMSPDMQMQVSPASNQGVPGQSPSSLSAFPDAQQHRMPQRHSNVLNNSHHPHLQGSAHPASTEQQVYAMRLARERQRILQKQHLQRQQLPVSGALMSQTPMSTALQNTPQTQLQDASQPLPPLTPSSPMPAASSQQQKKHQLLHQSGSVGTVSQTGKQRQRQAHHLQQSQRHQPQQRQPSQSHQQAKQLKGMGKGNLPMHQNLPADSSHPSSLSSNFGSQLEKGEQATYLMEGSKPLVTPEHSHPHQKLCSDAGPGLSKQNQQIHSHPDGDSPSHASAATSASAIPTSNQGISPPVTQLKVHYHPAIKLVNHTQPAIDRAVAQNHVTNSNSVAKHQKDQSQAKQHFEDSTSLSTTPGIPPVNASNMSKLSGNEATSSQSLGLKQPSNNLASHGSIKGKQLQQSQTATPNQVLQQKKHQSQQQLLEQRQPLLHQHPKT